MTRLPHILAFALALVACDKSADEPPPKEVVAALAAKPLIAGTAFRAKIDASSVLPKFPSKKTRRKTGQRRAVETLQHLETKFYAELITVEPEKWRIDYETFTSTVGGTAGAEAVSTFDLPDKAFFVDFAPEDGPSVTDEVGGEATESQAKYNLAVAQVLRERHAWGEFVSSREFGRGKIVESPNGIVLGRLVDVMLGPVADANTTVSFFRWGEDAAKNGLGYFDVHSRFRALAPDMKEGDYLDFESKGRATLRASDGTLVGYALKAKVTPRAKTDAMRPEGSGTWQMTFRIDTLTFQTPQ